MRAENLDLSVFRIYVIIETITTRDHSGRKIRMRKE